MIEGIQDSKQAVYLLAGSARASAAMEVAEPQEIDLYEAVLEFMNSSTEMRQITLADIRVTLEKRFGIGLDEHKNLLKQSMHAFFENLIAVDEQEETAQLRNTSFRKKKFSDGLVVTPAHLSTELTTFMGVAFCPRIHVTRKIWAYIKELDLQNPLNRTEILCDSTLQNLFGRKKFSMLKMTKYLSRMMKSAHCVPEENFKNIPKAGKNQNSRESIDSTSNPNTRKAVLAELSPDSRAAIKIRDKLRNALAKQDEARRLRKKNSFLKKKALKLAAPSDIQIPNNLAADSDSDVLAKLSPLLAEFIGLEEASFSEVSKMTSLYIEANNLRDSETSRIVHPDARMQELFGTNDLTLAKVMRVIRSHLIIPEPAILEGTEEGAEDDDGVERSGTKRERANSAVSKVIRKQRKVLGGTKKLKSKASNSENVEDEGISTTVRLNSRRRPGSSGTAGPNKKVNAAKAVQRMIGKFKFRMAKGVKTRKPPTVITGKKMAAYIASKSRSKQKKGKGKGKGKGKAKRRLNSNVVVEVKDKRGRAARATKRLVRKINTSTRKALELLVFARIEALNAQVAGTGTADVRNSSATPIEM